MNDQKKKDGRGGARPGAGRPKGSFKPADQKKVFMNFKLAPDVARFLRENAGGALSQADLIEYAIRKTYARKMKKK